MCYWDSSQPSQLSPRVWQLSQSETHGRLVSLGRGEYCAGKEGRRLYRLTIECLALWVFVLVDQWPTRLGDILIRNKMGPMKVAQFNSSQLQQQLTIIEQTSIGVSANKAFGLWKTNQIYIRLQLQWQLVVWWREPGTDEMPNAFNATCELQWQLISHSIPLGWIPLPI